MAIPGSYPYPVGTTPPPLPDTPPAPPPSTGGWDSSWLRNLLLHLSGGDASKLPHWLQPPAQPNWQAGMAGVSKFGWTPGTHSQGLQALLGDYANQAHIAGTVPASVANPATGVGAFGSVAPGGGRAGAGSPASLSVRPSANNAISWLSSWLRGV